MLGCVMAETSREKKMTEDEVRAVMAQYKIDNPKIDWETREVYAVVNEETGEVDRIGAVERSRILGLSGGVDVA